MRNNVFLGSSRWVYINSDAGNPDTFNTKDNLVTGNWWDVGPARNPEGPGYNNQVIDNTQLTAGTFPPEAQKVMTEAGARPYPTPQVHPAAGWTCGRVRIGVCRHSSHMTGLNSPIT